MAIIALPQPTHINRNAISRYQSPVRLKSATTTGKIKESSKVLAEVRLFRLLPKNITESDTHFLPCCIPETFGVTAVAD